MSRRQAATDNRVKVFDWKREISDTLLELSLIPDAFTGKITISFNEGGIAYLEKKEVLK